MRGVEKAEADGEEEDLPLRASTRARIEKMLSAADGFLALCMKALTAFSFRPRGGGEARSFAVDKDGLEGPGRGDSARTLLGRLGLDFTALAASSRRINS